MSKDRSTSSPSTKSDRDTLAVPMTPPTAPAGTPHPPPSTRHKPHEACSRPSVRSCVDVGVRVCVCVCACVHVCGCVRASVPRMGWTVMAAHPIHARVHAPAPRAPLWARAAWPAASASSCAGRGSAVSPQERHTHAEITRRWHRMKREVMLRARAPPCWSKGETCAPPPRPSDKPPLHINQTSGEHRSPAPQSGAARGESTPPLPSHPLAAWS
jgi:hypothetical protein